MNAYHGFPPNRRDTFIRRFWQLIDSEGVELFQWVFYIVIMSSGLYNLTTADGAPISVHPAMGGMDYDKWCWLNVTGPAACLIGKMCGHMKRFVDGGVWFQLTGDATLSLAVLAYVIAVFHVESWGRGMYGGWLGFATFLSIVVLIIRDVRRISEPPCSQPN